MKEYKRCWGEDLEDFKAIESGGDPKGNGKAKAKEKVNGGPGRRARVSDDSFVVIGGGG